MSTGGAHGCNTCSLVIATWTCCLLTVFCNSSLHRMGWAIPVRPLMPTCPSLLAFAKNHPCAGPCIDGPGTLLALCVGPAVSPATLHPSCSGRWPALAPPRGFAPGHHSADAQRTAPMTAGRARVCTTLLEAACKSAILRPIGKKHREAVHALSSSRRVRAERHVWRCGGQ